MDYNKALEYIRNKTKFEPKTGIILVGPYAFID